MDKSISGSKRLQLAFGFVLLLPVPAMAQEKPLVQKEQDARAHQMFRASQISLYSSAATDLGTTWKGISAGRQEANPLLGQSRVRQGTVVIGSAVAFDLATRVLYRHGHQKFATILNFVFAGEHSYAAARNGWNQGLVQR